MQEIKPGTVFRMIGPFFEPHYYIVRGLFKPEYWTDMYHCSVLRESGEDTGWISTPNRDFIVRRLAESFCPVWQEADNTVCLERFDGLVLRWEWRYICHNWSEASETMHREIRKQSALFRRAGKGVIIGR
jgi:hypothetical protein